MDIYLLLIVMLILGPVQIILSLVAVFTTRNQKLKTHLGFYFACVGLYTVLVLASSLLIETRFEALFHGVFFTGAVGLAIYNIMLFANQKRLP